jgi:hypothetical protein
MRYDRREIMTRAWNLYRKNNQTVSFGECLHRSWAVAFAAPVNAQRIDRAKMAAGVAEETDTWYGWHSKGLNVRHGEHCLFQVELIQASKGDSATYIASFFGASQVATAEEAA